MAFYLLTWTYLIMSIGAETFQSILNLKEAFLLATTTTKKKMNYNWERLKKIMEKENSTNENDFSENEVPDLKAHS